MEEKPGVQDHFQIPMSLVGLILSHSTINSGLLEDMQTKRHPKQTVCNLLDLYREIAVIHMYLNRRTSVQKKMMMTMEEIRGPLLLVTQ